MAEILATFNFTDHSTYYSVSIANKAANPTKASIPSTYNSKPVTKIDTSGFQNCTSLRSVEVPATITEIGSSAFSGCSSLASIVMFPTTAPTLGSNAFDGISSAAKFYVFQAALSNYKTNWSTYSDQLVADDLRLYFILNASATKAYVDSAASTGVRSVVESSTDGKIKVNTNGVVADVSIHGWANKLDKMTGTSSFELVYTKTENGSQSSKPISISNTPSSLALRTPTGKLSATTPNAGDSSTAVATKGYVDAAIEALPEPMIFKGTVGTGGTVTWANLPAAATANEGWTYKVITDHATAPVCKIGDTIISNGSTWVVIPSGDEPDDTWRNIKVNGTELLGTAISTGAVNFKNGTNVTVTGSGNDITIASENQTVKGNGTAFGASDAVNFVGGTNVTVTPDTTAKTITIASNNQTVKAGSTTFGASDAVELVGGTNVTVTPNSTNKTITIASSYTDTNQTVKAGSTTFGANDVVGFVGGTNVTITPDANAKTITIASADKYHTPTYNGGLKIGTGTGVNDLYVPGATSSQDGVITTNDQEFFGSKVILTDPNGSDNNHLGVEDTNGNSLASIYSTGMGIQNTYSAEHSILYCNTLEFTNDDVKTTYYTGSHIQVIDISAPGGQPVTSTFHFPTDKTGSNEVFAMKSDIPALPSGNITVTDDILDGTGGSYSVKYAPYTSKGAGHLYTGATAPTSSTSRLNYDGLFAATKLYKGNTEIIPLPTTNTKNKVLLSTTTSGNPEWSSATSWAGKAGFLRVNSSGVISSVDETTYLTNSTDFTANEILLGNGAKKIKGSGVYIKNASDAWDEIDDYAVPTEYAISEYVGSEYVHKIKTGSVERAYIVTASNTDSALEITSASAKANTLAKRDSNGRLKVATPNASSDAANKAYADTKVTRVTTSGSDRAYIVTSVGTDNVLEIATGATTLTLMKRDGNGRAQIMDPASSRDIANKYYVDNHHDSTKVDKVTTSDTLPRAYIITAAGAQSVKGITNLSMYDTIMARDANGRAQVATPVDWEDAANKNYVDVEVAKKVNRSDVDESFFNALF